MIDIQGVTKHFDDVHALSKIDFSISKGEFVTIVGPSGCGKSTLLRIIAGLVTPSEGTVNKQDTSGAFVFQDSALLPWRTVQKNVELLMELEKIDKIERQIRAEKALEQVGLTGFEGSYPHQLSGGMKMRLSLARSLVLKPDFLLLDEPLSAVDELTREILQEEIHELWNQDKFTAILVTHNVTEAVYLSNKVIVMSPRPGEITHVVDIPFQKRNQLLRTKQHFTDIVNDISGKLRTWK